MSDPKLKDAMREIRAVMEKHDIGGAVTLVSETHSEYFHGVSPSWSCAFISNGQLRLKATEKDFKTRKQHRHVVSSTIHMCLQMRDLSAKNFELFTRVKTMLEQQFDIDHKPYHDHEPEVDSQ